MDKHSEIGLGGSSNMTNIYYCPDEYKDRILLIDHDAAIAKPFSLALQKDGFIVDLHCDPLTAISNFRTDLYDLVLIEVRLPNIDGFEIHDKIRDMDKRVKVCFMSKYLINYEALREQDLQMDCFISKPIEMQELVKKICAELE